MATLGFKTAFKYPFNRAKGMLNILWIFLPIIGWFALGGYRVRIIQDFCKGKFEQLPTLKFGSDLKLGLFMFLKAIPFTIAYMLFSIGLSKLISILGMPDGLSALIHLPISLFVIPILTINFLNKETVGSFFELGILRYVFANLGDYILAMLKSVLLGIIFFIMIIVLVGIPAGAFTKNIFLADFYGRKVKV